MTAVPSLSSLPPSCAEALPCGDPSPLLLHVSSWVSAAPSLLGGVATPQQTGPSPVGLGFSSTQLRAQAGQVLAPFLFSFCLKLSYLRLYYHYITSPVLPHPSLRELQPSPGDRALTPSTACPFPDTAPVFL